jgi:hypothetical protein
LSYKQSYQANFLTIDRKVILHERLIDYANVILVDIQGDAQSLEQITVRYDGDVLSTVLGSQLERLCYQRYLEPVYTRTEFTIKQKKKGTLTDDEHYNLYYRYRQKLGVECDALTEKECELEKSMLRCIKEEWMGKAKLLVKAAKLNTTVTGTAQNNAVDHLLKLLRLSPKDLSVLRYWSTGFWRKSTD